MNDIQSPEPLDEQINQDNQKTSEHQIKQDEQLNKMSRLTMSLLLQQEIILKILLKKTENRN